jgi:hypothetical protein
MDDSFSFFISRFCDSCDAVFLFAGWPTVASSARSLIYHSFIISVFRSLSALAAGTASSTECPSPVHHQEKNANAKKRRARERERPHPSQYAALCFFLQAKLLSHSYRQSHNLCRLKAFHQARIKGSKIPLNFFAKKTTNVVSNKIILPSQLITLKMCDFIAHGIHAQSNGQSFGRQLPNLQNDALIPVSCRHHCCVHRIDNVHIHRDRQRR